MIAVIDRERIDGGGGSSERLQFVEEGKVTFVLDKTDQTRPFAPGMSVRLMMGFGRGLRNGDQEMPKGDLAGSEPSNLSELAVMMGSRVARKARRNESILPVAVVHE